MGITLFVHLVGTCGGGGSRLDENSKELGSIRVFDPLSLL